MKTPFLLQIAVVLIALAYGHRSFAAFIDVNDWYLVSTEATASVADGGTTTPEFQGLNSTNTVMVFSYLDSSITLLDKQKITLSFDVTLDMSGSDMDFRRVQLGLYNSSSPHASGGRKKDGNNSAIKQWKGFLLERPADTNKNLTLYRKTAGDVPFNATSDTDNPTAVSNTKGLSMNFEDDTAVSFTLILERDGDDLVFSGSFAGNEIGKTTMSGAFSGGTYNTFDAFGFFIQAETGNTVTMNNLQFSNVSLEVVPEPSTMVLLFVALATVGFTWRRRSSIKA